MSPPPDNERTNPSAAAALKVLLQRAAARAAELGAPLPPDEFQQKCRKNLVKDLGHRADVLKSKIKLFISYSEVADEHLEVARAHFAATDDFEVKTWRDDKENRPPGITEDIIQRIGACSCFLGIWAGTYSTRQPKEGERPILDIPKVWMPAELGIARAKGSICAVLVHDDLHGDFHREAKLGEHNERFNASNLAAKLRKVEHDFRVALEEPGRPPRWRRDSPLDVDYSKWRDREYWPSSAHPKPDEESTP